MTTAANGLEIVSKLADGAVAEIYLANAVGFPSPVVLKLLRAELTTEATIVGRFLDEARLLETLDHPHIVRHLGSGRLGDGRVYLLTEHLPGVDLGTHLKRSGALPPLELVRLAEPLARALEYVHQRGVVHRDLKPDNVFLVEGGQQPLAKLLDFGLANFVGNKSVKTAEGMLLATPEYTPPECVNGARADARSDLYSFGVLLYEAATGAPPFVAPNVAELLLMHLNEQPRPLTGGRAAVWPVLERCLAKAPADRFASAAELAEALALVRARWEAGTHVSTGGRIEPVLEPLAAPSPAAEQVGERYGSYELVRLLGEGAMGRVFLARHLRLGRQVALKFLKPEHARNRELLQRFFQEAKTVNQVNHEHIVEIHDFVEDTDAQGNPRAYCVMELLTGQDLHSLLAEEPMPVARTLRIARQVAAALGAAHKVGVVHRDVKPDNIFVTQRSGLSDYVKVLDFGVAKLVQSIGDLPKSRTQAGMIIGTPDYMAPEQATGTSTDARTDIYALGLVLYESLAGRRPFTSQSFGQLVVEINTRPPPPLPERTAGGDLIPPELVRVVERCLAKDPDDRFASMDELGVALEQIVRPTGERPALELSAGAPPAQARATTAAELAAVRPGRGRWVALGVAAAVIASAVATLALRPEPKPAATPAVEAPRPAPPPAAAVPAKVRLALDSTPPGAAVLRTDTGDALGNTPLAVELPRAEGTLPLRFSLPGHEAIDKAVSLAVDADVSVALVPRPRTAATGSSAPATRSKSERDERARKKKSSVSREAVINPFE